MEAPITAIGNSDMLIAWDIGRSAATVRQFGPSVSGRCVSMPCLKQCGSGGPKVRMFGNFGAILVSRKPVYSRTSVAPQECRRCRHVLGHWLDTDGDMGGALSCRVCGSSVQRSKNPGRGVCMSMNSMPAGKGGLSGVYGQDGRAFPQNGAANGAVTALHPPPGTAEDVSQERNSTLSDEFGLRELETPLPAPMTGRRVDDGFMFRERFMVRSYEVGVNRAASMETVAKLLQEVGCNHAQSVGFSTDGFATTPGMRKQGLIWVTTRMHIEMEEYPIWGEIVEIDTWFQGEGRVGARRDWIIKKVSTGETIGRGTSTWVMMNTATRRLARISEDVRAEYEQFCPVPPRYAFPEGKREAKKIPKLEEPPQCCSSDLRARRGDLDMNQHVNNVTYINWMLESIPEQTWESHELVGITLEYRCECHLGDAVESTASLESVDSQRRLEREAREAEERRLSAALATAQSERTGSSPISAESAGYKPFYSSSVIGLSNWWLEGVVGKTESLGIVESVSEVEEESRAAVAEKDLEQYVHFLRLQPGHRGEGKELNRGRTVWRRTQCPLPL